MPDITITTMDLAKGLKPRSLVVPPMPAEVVLKNPPAELRKAIKDDKLIIQKIAAAALDVLNKAREAISGAIADLDAAYEKSPPGDVREAEARVATLNAMCKKIAEAQSSAATAAARQAWDRHVRKNKDLTKFNAVFALNLTLGTISVAVSVTAAVLSVGTLAVTILGAAKTVAGMAADTYNFCRGMDKAERDIIDTDLALSKSWNSAELTKGMAARELAAALGVPFVKSAGTMQALLTEYNAKNARKDRMADKMWAQAKKLMTKVEAASGQGSEAQQALLKKLAASVDTLLDKIGELDKAGASNDLFYEAYAARCASFQAMEGGKLGKTASATGVMVMLAGIASTAETVVDIATKLA